MPVSTGSASASGSSRRRLRHGRAGRSSVTGPELPMIDTREEAFDTIADGTMEYLRSLWPNELSTVSLAVAGLPFGADEEQVLPRWHVYPQQQRIVLYRVPIQRLARLHVNDDFHRRANVEACVIAAAAEYLGRDPWDLAPGRFHPF